MLASHAVFFDQEAQLAPGFDQAVVDRRVLLLASTRPGAIRQLFAQDSLYFRQMPEAFDGATSSPSKSRRVKYSRAGSPADSKGEMGSNLSCSSQLDMQHSFYNQSL